MREETFLDGAVRLIQGDCLDVIPTLGKVDVTMADPPYEAHMHDSKKGKRGIRADGYANPPPVEFASIDGMRDPLALQVVEVTLRWALFFCTPEGVAPWRDALEAAGAKYKRACIWEKPDSAPQFNGQGPAMGAEMFVAAWCGPGHANWNGGGRRNIFKHATNAPDREGQHPTEKPLTLMRELVSLFTNPDDLVLDPTCGSGTTGVACVKLGRRFYGIEKDPRWFDLSCERIEKATRQADLFIAPPSKPVQEAMF